MTTGFARALELARSGKLAEAEQLCLEVTRPRPDFEALHLLGVIANLTGRPELAVDRFTQAIALRSGVVETHNDLGNALRALRRFDEALSQYDTAIALRPGTAELHDNRGTVLRDMGRLDDALASYDQAIVVRPDFAQAHDNRGNLLNLMKRPEAALASFDTAIALRPDFAEAHNNRGNTLCYLGRSEDALRSYDTAIALRPDFVEAHGNRGNALHDLGNFDAALRNFDKAIALQPDAAAVHGNRAVALHDLGQYDAALAGFERSIELDPDATETYGNLSLCLLSMGDYERGWEMHEWRWNTASSTPRYDLRGLPWLGEGTIAGKTILVFAEQGMGDTLQFCRYVPELAARGAAVVLEVQRPLVRLLSGLSGVKQVAAAGDPLPRIDAWIPMMSLPLAFRTTLETIPATVPYLNADPERVAAWRARLAKLPGRKVGLVWAGSRRRDNPRMQIIDRRRSITLEHYVPLAAIPGLSLISLQKNDGPVTPPDGMVLHDWMDEVDDFADTVALVEALDLVVSVDTSVVHLAGALGKPVWVLNRFDQCWRWLHDRDDSPWYPTARLFRQPSPGDWSSVIRAVAEALRAGD